jgi:peptidoglycan/LPS O-acetylase OafA/YrhL
LLTPYVDHQLNFFEGTLFVFVSLLATYSIAPVVYTVIEEPAMHAGYWLSGKLDRFAQPATQDSAEGNQG